MTKITLAFKKETDHGGSDDVLESKLIVGLPDGTKLEEPADSESELQGAALKIAARAKAALEEAGEEMGELIVASVPPSKISVVNMEVTPPQSYTREICAVPGQAWNTFREALILAMQGLLD